MASILRNASPELSRKMIFSTTLLIIAAAGLLTTHFGLIPVGSFTRTILEHAFEGALIGGLCDWFAVEKTYKAIETNHHAVARGIGRYVRHQVLDASVIRTRILALLDDPATMTSLREQVDGVFESEHVIAKHMRAAWEPLRHPVCNWIAALDLTEERYNRLDEVLSDKIVVETAKTCLIKSFNECTYTAEFKELEDSLREKLLGNGYKRWIETGLRAVTRNDQTYFQHIANAIANGTADDRLMQQVTSAFVQFKKRYIISWNSLSLDSRRDAATRLIDPIADQLVTSISNVAFNQMRTMRENTSLRSIAPIRMPVEFLASRISDEHLDYLSEAVVKSLMQVDSQSFAATFEMHTRAYLENIRINGTGLGFILGGFVGYFLI